MGQVVGFIHVDKEIPKATVAMGKFSISSKVAQASRSQGLSRQDLIKEYSEANEILSGGDYSIESLISLLDNLGLKVMVVPK